MNLIQRLEKIHTVDDAEKQLTLAKKYVRRLRTDAKKASMLADKLAIHEKLKDAEKVLRKLRQMIFDMEDAINVGKPASSAFSGSL